MNDWTNVELHYANALQSLVFGEMCENALPWEFYYCVVPSHVVGARGTSAIIVVPIAFFDTFGQLPFCPIYIDDILPNLYPSLDLEHEWHSHLSVEDARAMMHRLGFIESAELQNFIVDFNQSLVIE